MTVRRRWDRPTLRAGLILGFLVFAGYWLQTRGLVYTTPSRSSFITGAGIVLVPFFDWAVFRTRVLTRHWAGTILAVGGLYLLIGGVAGRLNFGDVLTVACAAAFSLHLVLAAKYATAHDTLVVSAIQVFAVAVFALPTLPFSPRTPMTTELVITIVLLALVNTSLAIYLLMWAQARVSATEAALTLSFEPVAAAITSIIVGDDRFTVMFATGGALVIAGMLLAQLGAARPRVDREVASDA